jgi:acyl-CoA synthetase (AMP-forming)/AMP-acid ligase II
MSANVVDYFAEAVRRHPNRPALIAPGGGLTHRQPDQNEASQNDTSQTWTYDQLDMRVDWLAAGLRSIGLGPGDRAIVMVPMSLSLYQVLLAVLKIGATAVFVDPWVGASQIAQLAAYAEPKAYIGIGKSHLVRLLDRRLRTMPMTVTTGRRVWFVPARYSLDELVRYDGPIAAKPVRAEDTALVTFTSGSSGHPKGANRTHGFLGAQHRALAAEFPYEPGDVDMPSFPVFSLNNLATGITTVIPDMDFQNVAEVDPTRILAQIERHGVTTSTASPPLFDRLAEYLQTHPEQTPPLRRILTGGAPISDAQLRTWESVFVDTEIEVLYGSTEAEPVAHLSSGERLALAGQETDTRKSSSPRGYCVGRPVAAIETRVIAIDDGPVQLGDGGWEDIERVQGEVGELVVCGEHVCQSYFRNPEATAENKFRDDHDRIWHRMGDTGYFDEQGRFWLTGRVHSTIRRGERLVQPQLVEQAATGRDSRIRRAAAVGMADTTLGERVVLVLELEIAKTQALEDDVRRRLETAEQVVDDIVMRTEALPVDPRHNSKIDYAAVRTLLRT